MVRAYSYGLQEKHINMQINEIVRTTKSYQVTLLIRHAITLKPFLNSKIPLLYTKVQRKMMKVTIVTRKNRAYVLSLVYHTTHFMNMNISRKANHIVG